MTPASAFATQYLRQPKKIGTNPETTWQKLPKWELSALQQGKKERAGADGSKQWRPHSSATECGVTEHGLKYDKSVAGPDE
jgi:hypothetical protein